MVRDWLALFHLYKRSLCQAASQDFANLSNYR